MEARKKRFDDDWEKANAERQEILNTQTKQYFEGNEAVKDIQRKKQALEEQTADTEAHLRGLKTEEYELGEKVKAAREELTQVQQIVLEQQQQMQQQEAMIRRAQNRLKARPTKVRDGSGYIRKTEPQEGEDDSYSD